MWKKDEPARPFTGQGPAGDPPAAPSTPPPTRHVSEPAGQTGRENVNIGKSVIIKGELSGSEDLTIEGQVDGKIELRENVLTIGPNARIKAQVFAKAVVVLGKVNGNVSATEKVDIREHGSVEGDIVAPRVAIADGAYFRGSIDMQRTAKPAEAKKEESKPVAMPVAPAGALANVTPH
ncbi:MAG TPA: polymer-forming cytoskeletal protein [Vicinamibacterales bacterium]|nr:polymer-forming cytoskeletal protein [Vicinamibacterales bacterium]